MIDLISIEETCVKASGIKKIFLIQPEHTATESPYRCIAMIDAPTLKEGKGMYSITFDRNTARYKESKNIDNKAGDFYNISLNFTIKQTRIETETLSTLLQNRRVHALIQFQTGRVKYVKNLRCQDDSDSGDKTNKSEHRFAFSTQSVRNAPSVGGNLPDFITGIVPAPAGGDCAMIGISPTGERWCIKVDEYGSLYTTKIV